MLMTLLIFTIEKQFNLIEITLIKTTNNIYVSHIKPTSMQLCVSCKYENGHLFLNNCVDEISNSFKYWSIVDRL